MNANPLLMHEKTESSLKPVHVAAMHQTNASVVTVLCNTCSQVPEESDIEFCRLSLHTTAAFNPNVEVIRALMRAGPEEIWAQDECGLLPLHIAAQQSSSSAVVNALCAAYPNVSQ